MNCLISTEWFWVSMRRGKCFLRNFAFITICFSGKKTCKRAEIHVAFSSIAAVALNNFWLTKNIQKSLWCLYKLLKPITLLTILNFRLYFTKTNRKNSWEGKTNLRLSTRWSRFAKKNLLDFSHEVFYL